MTQYAGISVDQLKSFIQRLENLNEQKAQVLEDIREVYAEAKSFGFDTKILRQVLKLRAMKTEDRHEQEQLLDLYMNAIDMSPGASAEAA